MRLNLIFYEINFQYFMIGIYEEVSWNRNLINKNRFQMLQVSAVSFVFSTAYVDLQIVRFAEA